MKIQTSIQTPGYWTFSAYGHRHIFKGLIHLINDHHLGVKTDKLKIKAQPPDQYTKGEFAIKLNLGPEELSWLFPALQSFRF